MCVCVCVCVYVCVYKMGKLIEQALHWSRDYAASTLAATPAPTLLAVINRPMSSTQINTQVQLDPSHHLPDAQPLNSGPPIPILLPS